MRSGPCSVCGKVARRRCSVCKTVYCSRQCQTEDWRDHISLCQPLPALHWVSERGDQQPVTYPEAIISRELPARSPEKDKLYRVFPLDNFESCQQFSVKIVGEEEDYRDLELGLSDPPPGTEDWEARPGQLVTVSHLGNWRRGLCLESSGPVSRVYLVDEGCSVRVSQDDLRPMSPSLRCIPPLAYQVCLAGVGHHGQSEKERIYKLISDPDLKLMAEFLGQLECGRWLVRLESEEDREDLSSVLVENSLCDPLSDPPVSFPVTSPRLARGEMPRSGCSAGVCHYLSPVSLYICQSSSLPLYSHMMDLAQESVPGTVDPVVGTACLAWLGDQWYRAEVTNLSRDQAQVTLFLIDYGRTMTESVSNLRPLPACLAREPGVVTKVRLVGIKPCHDEAWTEVKREVCSRLLEGRTDNVFHFHPVRFREEECLVRTEDTDGNDLASLLVMNDLAERDDTAVTRPSPSVLQRGQQDLLILNVNSPIQFYLASHENFVQFTFLNSSLSRGNDDQTETVRPSVGDLVLVYKNGIWNRAEIVNVLINDFYEVEMFDFAQLTIVGLKDMCRAKQEMMNLPVLATKCGLYSFRDREDQAYHEPTRRKMKVLMKRLESIEVDVVEEKDGVTWVRIETVEKQLWSD